MRGWQNSLDEILSSFLSHFRQDSLARQEVNENPPLRSALLRTVHMELHAQHLPKALTLASNAPPDLLLTRLSDNEKTLFDVANMLQDAGRAKKAITPAGEWLLDNFYLIE